MSLSVWQYSFNGVTLGAGTPYGVTQATGLRELPPARVNDTPKGRLDGVYGGLQLLDARIIAFNATVTAKAGAAAFESSLEALAAAFAPIQDPNLLLPFQFYPGGFTLGRAVQTLARPSKGGYPVNKPLTIGFTDQLAVELRCLDPLWYDTVASTATTGLPSPTSGLHFPATFPISFGSSSGGSMSVTNAGNYPTAPVFTITGPCLNPQVSLTATGQFLKFGISLANTDTLTVDCGARTVILNSMASRYNTIQAGSQWFTCPVGTQTFGFTSGDATSVAAQCTVSIRSAWAWL